jgi:hypothetical protein
MRQSKDTQKYMYFLSHLFCAARNEEKERRRRENEKKKKVGPDYQSKANNVI